MSNSNLVLAGIGPVSLAWFGPVGSTAPTTATAAPDAAFIDAGYITEDGLSVKVNESSKDIKAYGSQAPVRVISTESKTEFEIEFLETNETSLAIYHRKELGSLVASDPVDEVQLVTITGTPAGGTFTLTYAGQTTSALAFDAVGATVQTAFRLLSTVDDATTVAGSAGGPYTITFLGTQAGSDQAAVTGSAAGLTGGTTPALVITTPTPGSSGGVINFSTGPASTERYAAIFDMVDGDNHMRAHCPLVEVTDRGDLAIKAGEAVTYPVTLTAYPNEAGINIEWFLVLDALAA